MKLLNKFLLVTTAALFLATEAHAVLTWARPYDPNLGRWIQRDPIEEQGGLNLYAYVFNDPLNFIDPEGLIGTPAENIALVIAVGEQEAAETIGPVAARIAAQSIARKQAEDQIKRQIIKQLAEEAEKRMKKTAQEVISKECKGSINREFPKQFLNKTLENIDKLAKQGDKR
jgi:uncharacterized protein RhaS with RHS repeats